MGRLVGAIGTFYGINKTIYADNLDAAKLKLYDTHEHISSLTVLSEKEIELDS